MNQFSFLFFVDISSEIFIMMIVAVMMSSQYENGKQRIQARGESGERGQKKGVALHFKTHSY